MSRATTRGSRYFPKVSLIRSLVRSSAGHVVEGLGELADLVLARHRHRRREVARLDGPGPVDEAPEGPDQALGARGAEAEAHHHRHREEDQVQAEDALLLRVGALGRGPGQRGELARAPRAGPR